MKLIWAYICGTNNEWRTSQTFLIVLTEKLNDFRRAFTAKDQVPRDPDNITSRAMSKLSVRSLSAMSHSSELYRRCEEETQDPRVLPISIFMAEPIIESATPEASRTRIERKLTDSEKCFATFNIRRQESPPQRSVFSGLFTSDQGHPNFKPANLAKFSQKPNVAIIFRLYKSSMYVTDEAMKNHCHH
ncbi:hypothetical protein DSO57_1021258 [Entomophthora muscae]|uniref:Uncharacterized protein n=1 Tax=Entomophthora muscae TaxID=34485 RepID=A0ACC2RI93_9FUNG|nr:hypothetical protein DSO57_1021258 [Entomophthora muscae]